MQQCEVNLVNKLCTLGLIERYSSDRVKKEKLNYITNSFNVVNVNEKLVKDIYSLLEDLNIKPMIHKDQVYNYKILILFKFDVFCNVYLLLIILGLW